MTILLTNDDGIHAPGLYVLADLLLAFDDVFIAAPDRERSGVGHAIDALMPDLAVDGRRAGDIGIEHMDDACLGDFAERVEWCADRQIELLVLVEIADRRPFAAERRIEHRLNELDLLGRLLLGRRLSCAEQSSKYGTREGCQAEGHRGTPVQRTVAEWVRL